MIKIKLNIILWIETYDKTNGREIKKEKIDKLNNLISNYPQVVHLLLTNYHVNIKDNTPGEVIKHKINLFKYQL